MLRLTSKKAALIGGMSTSFFAFFLEMNGFEFKYLGFVMIPAFLITVPGAELIIAITGAHLNITGSVNDDRGHITIKNVGARFGHFVLGAVFAFSSVLVVQVLSNGAGKI